MSRRIAFVVNGDAGAELVGGRRDATQVFSVLMDPLLGGCDPAGPSPLLACPSRLRFTEELYSIVRAWDREDQLLFYFSGHGCIRNGKYALAFGAAPHEQFLSFESIAAELQTHGVTRAVLVIDACHSGAAIRPGTKAADNDPPRIQDPLPEGIVLLASCRHFESSFELDEGSRGSVFTHLLIDGITSGLRGKPTPDNLIGPDDIIAYVRARLAEPEYAKFPQSPMYQVSSANRTVWISRNCSRPSVASVRTRAIASSLEELHVLYERTDRARHPCLGADLECLDWSLVRQHAEASGTPLECDEPHEEFARRLGLYSTLSELKLHNAAVLCFARAPHLFVQQARSILVRGGRGGREVNRIDVLGPLSTQIHRLTQLVLDDVSRELARPVSDRESTPFSRALREAISNAVTHRDYSSTELVQVTVDLPRIVVSNPGSFPKGVSFDALLEVDQYSAPTDAALAWYLTTLLAYEGVGRGFSVFRELREHAGAEAIHCEENRVLGTVKLTLRIDTPSAASKSGRPPPSTEATVAHAPAAPESSTGHLDTMVLPDPTERLATVAADTRLGMVLGEGRYRLIRQVGAGGSGSVYVAEDRSQRRHVAIKLLSRRFVTVEQQKRFQQEASLGTRINHRGVVKVHEFGTEHEHLFMVMEYVDGVSLSNFISRSSMARRAFEESFIMQSVLFIRDIAEALSAAHDAMVVHRDIKPSNVLVDRNGHAHILDFGISRAFHADASALTATGVILGTIHYMSPEHLEEGGVYVDARSDIYSLGSVMYEVLSGSQAYPGIDFATIALELVQNRFVPLRELQPRLPTSLVDICSKAMHSDPDQRYQKASEMVEALTRHLKDVHFVANDDAARERLWKIVSSWLE